MYLNRITLIGFLGKDAEARTAQASQARYTVLSLATKRSWRDRESGERMSQTTWHRRIVWNKLGEFAGTLAKGAHLLVEGEIRTREYVQPAGKGKKSAEIKRTITEVRVTSIQNLDRPVKAAGQASEQQEAPF